MWLGSLPKSGNLTACHAHIEDQLEVVDMMDDVFWYVGDDEIGKISDSFREAVVKQVDKSVRLAINAAMIEMIKFSIDFPHRDEFPEGAEPSVADLESINLYGILGESDFNGFWSYPIKSILSRSFELSDHPEELAARLKQAIDETLSKYKS